MRSIYKYDIIEAENGVIEGPITKLLTAQAQYNTIVVWAEVDTTAPNRKFRIVLVGTGWPLDALPGKKCILDTHTYISTVQLDRSNLVFHVYGTEIIPNPINDKKAKNENIQKEKAKAKINKQEAALADTNCVINHEILQKFLH